MTRSFTLNQTKLFNKLLYILHYLPTHSLEQDNQITQDLVQKLLSNLDNPQTILEIINLIKNQNLKSTQFDYFAIFNKLIFKDKTFFKTFTHNKNKLSY